MFCRTWGKFFAFLDLSYFLFESFSVGVDLRFCWEQLAPIGGS